MSDTAATKQVAAQIQVALDTEFHQIVFDSGKCQAIDSLAFELPIDLKPRTRYYWCVTVWANNGEMATSEIAWFETAKLMNRGKESGSHRPGQQYTSYSY